jgi:organic radical activating enzyme
VNRFRDKTGQSAVVEIPQIGLKLNAQQLLKQQKLAAEHVTFSLTEACPLRCSHCIVATVPAADASRTMPVERAERYAAQLPALRERGVWLVSFTGGEPLLAPKQLFILSEAAAHAGMECTVVTACHWARSEASARQTVNRFPAISNWQLSADLFHREFIPPEYALRAARAALEAERRAMVRMAASLPLSAEHRKLYDELRSELPEDVPVVVQPVIQMGRGVSVETTNGTGQAPAWPCIPDGMVFRFDGTMAPCCAGLVDEREGHPFQYGHADTAGLAEAHQRWCADPLLQLIRAVGFTPILGWVAETHPEHSFLKEVPTHPCECCTKLWRDPQIVTEIRQRAERPENRQKIAALTEFVFGEQFMKRPVMG